MGEHRVSEDPRLGRIGGLWCVACAANLRGDIPVVPCVPARICCMYTVCINCYLCDAKVLLLMFSVEVPSLTRSPLSPRVDNLQPYKEGKPLRILEVSSR